MINTIKDAATAVGETVLAAKEATQDVRRSAARILDQAGTGSSEALHSTASAIDGIADRTGQYFASASKMVEPCETDSILHDLRRIVRRHPGSFLLLASAVAATAGYMAGSGKSVQDRG